MAAAVVSGYAVGTKNLDTADKNVGEARKADEIIEAGFPTNDDKMSELVLIQSKTKNVDDPAFKAVIADVTETLATFPQLSEIESPANSSDPGLVSQDRHAVRVTFTPSGDYDLASTYIDTIDDAVAKVQERHPDFYVDELGSVSNKRARRRSTACSRRPE